MMRTLALVSCLALLAGCFGDGAAAITGVTPALADNTATTPITIVGYGFDCGIDERFDADAAYVSWAFSAHLGTTALANLTWLDTTRLGAEVPAGMAPATYDLEIVRPDGRKLELPRAFTVSGAADCLPGDQVVRDAGQLAAAFVTADTTPGTQRICVDAVIALGSTVSANDSVVLYGSSRAQLDGSGLPAGAVGLRLAGSSRVEDLRFVDFADGAVRLVSGDLGVSDAVFERCSPGIAASSTLEVVGSRFIEGAIGVRVSGTASTSVAVRRCIFSDVGRGVEVDDGGALTVDNSTFFRVASESVRAEEVAAVRLRNNIFQQFGGNALELSGSTMAEPATANALSPEVACSACAFDATNPVVDCRLAAPDSGDFTLDPASPCIDRGVDVGLPFLGSAPDLGAAELR